MHGPLQSFQFFTIIRNSAVNILVHASLQQRADVTYWMARSRNYSSVVQNLPFSSSTLAFSWLASFSDSLTSCGSKYVKQQFHTFVLQTLQPLSQCQQKCKGCLSLDQLGSCAHPWPYHCSAVVGQAWVTCPLLGLGQHDVNHMDWGEGEIGDLLDKNQDYDTSRRRRHVAAQAHI